MVSASFGTGQVLWSLLWFFLFMMWIWLVISIFGDIVRRDMPGAKKALWVALVVFFPYLGVFVYLIVNGGSMAQRGLDNAQANQEMLDEYIRKTAGGRSAADELAKLAELHDAGKLDDAEFAAAKAKAVAD